MVRAGFVLNLVGALLGAVTGYFVAEARLSLDLGGGPKRTPFLRR